MLVWYRHVWSKCIYIYIYHYNKKSNNQRTVCNDTRADTASCGGLAVWPRSGSNSCGGSRRSPSSHFQKATPSPVSILGQSKRWPVKTHSTPLWSAGKYLYRSPHTQKIDELGHNSRIVNTTAFLPGPHNKNARDPPHTAHTHTTLPHTHVSPPSLSYFIFSKQQSTVHKHELTPRPLNFHHHSSSDINSPLFIYILYSSVFLTFIL